MGKNLATKLANATSKSATAKKAENKAAKDAAGDRAKSAEAFRQAKKEKTEACRKEHAGLFHHMVTVTGGNRDVGEGGECIWLGVNKRYINTQLARVLKADGETLWINPKHLTAGKPLTAARIAVLTAEQEEQANETTLMDGVVVRQGDKGVVIRNSGIFKDMSFALTMVERVGEMPANGDKPGNPIFRVPTWKLRSEVGQLAVDALEAKAEMYTANIEE